MQAKVGMIVTGLGLLCLTAPVAAHHGFDTIQRQGWNKNDLLAGEKVTFTGHAGKVVESRGALDSLVKVSAPKQEIFKGQKPDALASN